MKIALPFFLIFLLVNHSSAQRGRVDMIIGAELGLPTGNFSKVYRPGKGGVIKWLFTGKSGDQLNFSAGYYSFNIKEGVLNPGFVFSSNYTIIPVLFGYRRYINRFYSETQAGTGIYTINVTALGQKEQLTDVNFTWAQSFGFIWPHLDLSVRYQQGNLKDAGVNKLTMIGINGSYRISFFKKRNTQ